MNIHNNKEEPTPLEEEVYTPEGEKVEADVFHYFQMMDRAAVFSSSWDDHITDANEPVLLSCPALQALADEISSKIAEFYQLASKEFFDKLD